VVISVLFWTLANDVCTVADAKIIYPSLGGRLVVGQHIVVGHVSHDDLDGTSRVGKLASPCPASAGIAANIALVVAGNYMKWVNAALTSGSLLLSLRYLVATVLVLSGVMMGAKLYIDGNIKSVDVRPRRPACMPPRLLLSFLQSAGQLNMQCSGIGQPDAQAAC
jgi:ATP:ADP antiporter, AAA family